MGDTNSQIIGLRIDAATLAALDKLVAAEKHKSRSACIKHLILQRSAEIESTEKNKEWLIEMLADEEIKNLIIQIVTPQN